MSDKNWTYAIRQGGLMRCCIESIHLAMQERDATGLGAPEEGDLVVCRYDGGKTRMKFVKGAWEWESDVVGPLTVKPVDDIESIADRSERRAARYTREDGKPR